jgi:linoleoyl-CoA desaturase
MKSVRFAPVVDPFFVDLLRRESAYFAPETGRRRRAGPAMWTKTAVIASAFLGLGAIIYFGGLEGAPFVAVFVAWQFTQFLSTIGVAHDAAHYAYTRSRRANERIVKIFDFLGIDSAHWLENHVGSHHGLPNVPLRDAAIESFSLVRLHPRTNGGWIHRFQHFYMFGVYSLVTIFQVYFLEPVSFAQRVVGFERREGWQWDLARIVAKKFAVLGWSLLAPLALLPNPWWEVVTGWFVGHLVCGVFLGVTFMTTHLHEKTSFIEPDADGVLPLSFARHVLATTAEFSVDNPVIMWLSGGLNLHVTHHLFPNVSQTHLPALSRIVRETARAHGVTYVQYSLWGALASHLRMLKKLGAMPDGIERAPVPQGSMLTVRGNEPRAQRALSSEPPRRAAPALAGSSSAPPLESTA